MKRKQSLIFIIKERKNSILKFIEKKIDRMRLPHYRGGVDIPKDPISQQYYYEGINCKKQIVELEEKIEKIENFISQHPMLVERFLEEWKIFKREWWGNETEESSREQFLSVGKRSGIISHVTALQLKEGHLRHKLKGYEQFVSENPLLKDLILQLVSEQSNGAIF